jgi:hypothetical protein
MRIVQALTWFRDERSNFEAIVDGVVRHLAQSSQKRSIVEDLRDNIRALPAWMYPVVETITRDTRVTEEENAPGLH